MRNNPLFLFICLLFPLCLSAQVPQYFNYQAVVRDAAGNPIANHNIRLRFSIYDYWFVGLVYQEEQTVTTTTYGLVTVKVGSGIPITGNIYSIDWNQGNYYLFVETDTSGGSNFTFIGEQQLVSVPYALQAARATTVPNTWSTLGNSNLNDTLNFIGTTNTDVLNFRVYNMKAGKIDRSKGNTFFGMYSGDYATGFGNTGLGTSSLQFTTTGNQNIAIGQGALTFNKTSVGNTAIGYDAQRYANGQGSPSSTYNTSVGFNALMGFPSQTNNACLYNSAFGAYALKENSTGNYNSALGSSALRTNGSGSSNTASGNDALFSNTSGSENVASGRSALYSNTTGNKNLAIGTEALNFNVTGSGGVAIGWHSQFYVSNTTSAWENTNTSVGFSALEWSTNPANNSGVDNTAIGYYALQAPTSASYNTAIGARSLAQTSVGNNNSALGWFALFNNSSGSSNTAVGYYGMRYNTTGTLNTSLGYGAGVGIGFTNLTNSTAIGANAVVNVSNAVVLGNNANVGIGLSNPTHKLQLGTDDAAKPTTSTWSIVSDVRLKNVDGEYAKGLNEILQLKPIMFHYKNTGGIAFAEQVLNTQAIGFSAQEVQKVFPECVTTDAEGYLNLNMHAILVAEVNAIKEQQREIDTLRAENEKLQAEISLIKAKLGL